MIEQGETYAGHIEAQREVELDRRSALDDRALGVTKTNSAFLALVFALSVLVTGEDYLFTGLAALAVVVALFFFVSAAVLGLVANLMRDYEVTGAETMQAMLTAHWQDDEVEARNAVATANLRTIRSLRSGNDEKVRWIKRAVVLQFGAITVLVAALAIALGQIPA